MDVTMQYDAMMMLMMWFGSIWYTDTVVTGITAMRLSETVKLWSCGLGFLRQSQASAESRSWIRQKMPPSNPTIRGICLSESNSKLKHIVVGSFARLWMFLRISCWVQLMWFGFGAPTGAKGAKGPKLEACTRSVRLPSKLWRGQISEAAFNMSFPLARLCI